MQAVPVVMPLLLVLAAAVPALAPHPIAQDSVVDASKPTAEVSPQPGGGSGSARMTRLIGTARTGRRRWVTGAAVLARSETGRPELYVTATDEKGRFRFEEMPEGPYRVKLLKHGLEPLTKNGVELKFPFRAVVEVVMKPAESPVPGDLGASESSLSRPGCASLTGRTFGRDGDPVDEVRVRLVRADGSVDPETATTDADGSFRMSGLVPGKWNLEILGAGYLPMRVPAELAGEVRLTTILVPQPANYEPQPLDLMPPEEPVPPPEPEPDPELDPVLESAPESEAQTESENPETDEDEVEP